MPKTTSGPKAIANSWKKKGLQQVSVEAHGNASETPALLLTQLKFYCQICQKQCRDANGFKCHLSSQTHRRAASVFSESSGTFVEDWSKKFEGGFVTLMRRRYGTREVRANRIYNEYIQDRHHVHMNATMWESLSVFVKYLGREGIARVREDEQGWFVAWVDTSQDAARRAADKAKALAKEKRAEVAATAELANIAAAAAAAGGGGGTAAGATGLDRDAVSQGPVAVMLAASSSTAPSRVSQSSHTPAPVAAAAFALEEEEEEAGGEGAGTVEGERGDSSAPQAAAAAGSATAQQRSSRWGGAPASGARDAAPAPGDVWAQVLAQDGGPSGHTHAAHTAHAAPTAATATATPSTGGSSSSWLMRGIIVKVLSRDVGGGEFYRSKGTVVATPPGRDGHPTAKLRIVRKDGSKVAITLPQSQVETVVPKPGGAVAVVTGPHAGALAFLEELHTNDFSASLRQAGSTRLLPHIPYEAFSKWDAAWAASHGVKPAHS